MSYSYPHYLISTEQLADSLETDSDQLRIFDVTVNLVPSPPGYKAVSGLEDYEKEHIPGATFIDLVSELSDTSSPLGLTCPSSEHLQTAYRGYGINADSQVVFYSTGHMMWATRAWWMLHSCGHRNVAVLNGGFASWRREGRAITDEVLTAQDDGDIEVSLNAARWADKNQVERAINDSATCTINALSPGVYSGEAAIVHIA